MNAGRARDDTLTLALTLAVSLGACGKNVPSSPANEEEELFHNACSRCHGQDGTGGPPDSLGHPGPRNFTDPAFQSTRTDAQLRTAIENGNSGMPAFGPVLTPKQLDLMIAHVRKFDPRARVAALAPADGAQAVSASAAPVRP